VLIRRVITVELRARNKGGRSEDYRWVPCGECFMVAKSGVGSHVRWRSGQGPPWWLDQALVGLARYLTKFESCPVEGSPLDRKDGAASTP